MDGRRYAPARRGGALEEEDVISRANWFIAPFPGHLVMGEGQTGRKS